MARKKVSPLAQAIALFNVMDGRDKTTLSDYIRTQTATPRKSAAKKEKKKQPILLPDNPDEFKQQAN